MDNRISSVDVLRGLTIFLMIIVNNPGSWSHVYPPLLHAKWHGCTPTDLVFPFFLFIVGVSMAFSFSKYKSENRSAWITKITRRTALIFLIGLLLNWFPFYHKAFSDLRIFGVLQRIALAFGGAGLLIIFLKRSRYLIAAIGLILLSYWGLLFLFGGMNPFALESNLCTKIDLFILGESHLYKGFGIPFDPEGLFSTLPGIAHVLIGHQIGKLLGKQHTNNAISIKPFILLGLALIFSGLIWNNFFPINKPIWTSSYVLYTCGLATITLSFLIWILDIKAWKGWEYPFRVFGLNPLISYVLSVLFIKIIMYFIKTDSGNLYTSLYQDFFKNIISPEFGSLLQALSFTGFIWLFAWYLYRKGKVIKI